MVTIKIADYLEGRSFPDAGKEVYKEMVKRMPLTDKIVLDLDGVDSLPSMFLNTSIGQIIDDYGVETMKQKIGFAKITVSQIERMKEYVSQIAP